MTDMVNHPPHYKDVSGVECIEVARHMGFCGGNCFKYLYRAGRKGDYVEDLKKAQWYAEFAYQQNEKVPLEAVEPIRKIADTSDRNAQIRVAMNMIAESNWDGVVWQLLAALERA